MTHIPPVNFASAVTLGSDYAGDYALIDLSRGSTAKGAPQVARFFATGAWTSGTTAGTLHLVLLDDSGVPVWSDTATLTPVGAVTAGSGRVVADVSFTKSGSDKIDLLGMRTPASTMKVPGAWKWKYAVTGTGDFTGDIEISVAISNEV